MGEYVTNDYLHFSYIKIKVCMSKRRNRQTSKYEWRLDIKNWQEEGVLISVRADGKLTTDKRAEPVILVTDR